MQLCEQMPPYLFEGYPAAGAQQLCLRHSLDASHLFQTSHQLFQRIWEQLSSIDYSQ